MDRNGSSHTTHPAATALYRGVRPAGGAVAVELVGVVAVVAVVGLLVGALIALAPDAAARLGAKADRVVCEVTKLGTGATCAPASEELAATERGAPSVALIDGAAETAWPSASPVSPGAAGTPGPALEGRLYAADGDAEGGPAATATVVPGDVTSEASLDQLAQHELDLLALAQGFRDEANALTEEARRLAESIVAEPEDPREGAPLLLDQAPLKRLADLTGQAEELTERSRKVMTERVSAYADEIFTYLTPELQSQFVHWRPTLPSASPLAECDSGSSSGGQRALTLESFTGRLGNPNLPPSALVADARGQVILSMGTVCGLRDGLVSGGAAYLRAETDTGAMWAVAAIYDARITARRLVDEAKRTKGDGKDLARAADDAADAILARVDEESPAGLAALGVTTDLLRRAVAVQNRFEGFANEIFLRNDRIADARRRGLIPSDDAGAEFSPDGRAWEGDSVVIGGSDGVPEVDVDQLDDWLEEIPEYQRRLTGYIAEVAHEVRVAKATAQATWDRDWSWVPGNYGEPGDLSPR